VLADIQKTALTTNFFSSLLGAFVGAGEIRSSVDLNYGETRSTLVFGGLYGRREWGPWFLRVAVQGGHSSNDTERTINNNLVPGGIERATGSFSGWYVSPEARVGFHHRLGTFAGASYTLTPSRLYGERDDGAADGRPALGG
jgi:uncharacterized protein with beta-barrel porin domain